MWCEQVKILLHLGGSRFYFPLLDTPSASMNVQAALHTLFAVSSSGNVSSAACIHFSSTCLLLMTWKLLSGVLLLLMLLQYISCCMTLVVLYRTQYKSILFHSLYLPCTCTHFDGGSSHHIALMQCILCSCVVASAFVPAVKVMHCAIHALPVVFKHTCLTEL